MRRIMLVIFVFCFATSGFPHDCAAAVAARAKRMELPAPDKSGGMPLMQALNERKTTRAFSGRDVSSRDLSNLLWAAWGVNRADGRHTAPSWRNNQAVRVYVVLASGVWEYDPQDHVLIQALELDARDRFGGAPAHLLYAAESDKEYAGLHVGSLYQNAGLYCASAGLGNVVKASGVNALDGKLKLPSGYKVWIVQSVGWAR